MKRVFIPDGGARGELARMLLDIVGRDRVAEVELVTRPKPGFMVPEDVAVEYGRRTCTPPDPEPTPTPELPAPVEELAPTPALVVPAQIPATRSARRTRKGGVTGG